MGDDDHHHQVLPDADGIYRSRELAGFWLRVEWLWQRPLPDPLAASVEIAGPTGAVAVLTALRAGMGEAALLTALRSALGDAALRALPDEPDAAR